jgi:hypothetical protein
MFTGSVSFVDFQFFMPFLVCDLSFVGLLDVCVYGRHNILSVHDSLL